jgi:hypothetical protein
MKVDSRELAAGYACGRAGGDRPDVVGHIGSLACDREPHVYMTDDKDITRTGGLGMMRTGMESLSMMRTRTSRLMIGNN